MDVQTFTVYTEQKQEMILRNKQARSSSYYAYLKIFALLPSQSSQTV